VTNPIESLEHELEQDRLIAILRLVDHTNVIEIASILFEAGVRFLEVTVERPDGFRSLEQVVNTLGNEANVGAGTVLTTDDVARALDAGARFIVSPDTNSEVMMAAHEQSLFALPGVLTPTDITKATSTGTRMIKLFPASLGGIGYLRALQGPFPNVKFVPTGGITSENASSWLAAGAAAVAMGSNLVYGSGDLSGLFERARQAVNSTSKAR
jgi:2-dehydro-3-deoxyphosphogluconate aldolase/(4S)-4-hydroxy-2-oxoglutarate aldolase